jgi:voltage-gated potassium channel
MSGRQRHWLSQYRFLILLLSLLFVDVLVPIFDALELVGARVLSTVFISLVLLSSVYTVSERKKLFLFTVSLAVIAICARVAVDLVPDPDKWMIVTALVLLLVFLLLISTIILLEVLKPGRVTGERISASICVYLLIGFLWAMVFTLVFVLDPQSFNIEGATFGHFIYYSYITLSTLGYGDITPLSPIARPLAYVEAIIGQIYLTVLVARLVGMHIAQERGE